MSEKTKKKILLIYGIALSVLLTVSGILLMAACFSIYKIGSRPFTPENISAAFAKISVPVWITVGAVIVGGILKLVMPMKNGKLRARADKKTMLSRMLSRLDAQDKPSELLLKIEKEKRLCKILLATALSLCVAAALPALIYSLNLNNYGADYNASVIWACALILPSAFISFGIAIAFVFLENASVERQLSYARAALAGAGGNFKAAEAKSEPTFSRAVFGVRVALAAVALVFIVLGILNGGMADVLAKAINICTECIGLG